MYLQHIITSNLIHSTTTVKNTSQIIKLTLLAIIFQLVQREDIKITINVIAGNSLTQMLLKIYKRLKLLKKIAKRFKFILGMYISDIKILFNAIILKCH